MQDKGKKGTNTGKWCMKKLMALNTGSSSLCLLLLNPSPLLFLFDYSSAFSMPIQISYFLNEKWKTSHKNCLLCRLGNSGKGNRPVQAGWGKLIIDTKIWITMSFFCIFSDWIVGLINGKINRPKNQLLSENATTWIHDKDVVHFTIQTFCTTVNYWEEGPNFAPPPPPKKKGQWIITQKVVITLTDKTSLW